MEAYNPNSPAVGSIEKVEVVSAGVNKVTYSMDNNIMKSIPIGSGNTLNAPWIPHSLQAHDTLKDFSDNAFTYGTTLSGSAIGIEATIKNGEYFDFQVGLPISIEAMSSHTGLRVFMNFLRSDGSQISSYSNPTNGTTGVTYAKVSATIPTETYSVRFVFFNTTALPLNTDVRVFNTNIEIGSVNTANNLQVVRRDKSRKPAPEEAISVVSSLPTLSDNLLSPFEGGSWTFKTASMTNLITKDRGCVFTATTTHSNIYEHVLSVKPNTTYYFNADSNLQIAIFNSDSSVTLAPYQPAGTLRSFNSNSYTQIRVYLSTVNISSGQFYAFNPFVSELQNPNIGTYGVFTDYTASLNNVQQYALKSIRTSGESSLGNWYNAPVNESLQNILSSTSDLPDFWFTDLVISRDSDKGRSSTLHKFAGRVKPTREYAMQRSCVVNTEIYIKDIQEAIDMENFLLYTDSILYRDSNGRRFVATTDNINLSDEQVRGFKLSVTFTETDSGDALLR